MKKLSITSLFFISLISLTACQVFQNENNQSTIKTDSKTDETGDSNQDKKDEENNSEKQSEKTDDSGDQDSDKPIQKKFDMQGSTIFHAFNWSMDNIKTNLDSIKAAGFTSIQISPMQPQKDPYQGNWKNEWWKLYQPLGFTIAKSGQNILGDVDSLKNLCSAANSKGIKIIVDVVSNHLAGDNGILYKNVEGFEGEIYRKKLTHSLNQNVTGDNDDRVTVQGRLGGLPDLKTEDELVQNRVLSLLKEYIDVGVSGFRFDAAKHIETPEDGDYASDFWPHVLDGATNYAISKNKNKPYFYGEILNKPGKDRKWEWYTKRMSVVDNQQGADLTNSIKKSSFNSFSSSYFAGNPSNLVLWAESHDTYLNNDDPNYSKNISESIINLSYAIQSSRSASSTLYFARPLDSTQLGQVGSTAYSNRLVKASNTFHNIFIDGDEKISKQNDTLIVKRKINDLNGVAIFKSNASSTSITYDSTEKYKDLLSGKKYDSLNSETIVLTDGAAFLVPADYSVATPEYAEPPVSNKDLVITNIDKTKTYLLWSWDDSSNANWYAFDIKDTYIEINIPKQKYIVVEFPLSTNINNANWDNKIRQTTDLTKSSAQIITTLDSLPWK